MNRVDQHEIGAMLAGVVQQFLEVAIVADTPGFLGPHGVHLGHPAPTVVLRDRLGNGNPRRGGQNGGIGGPLAVRHMEGMVAGRQIVRHGQRERVGNRGICAGVLDEQGVEIAVIGFAVFEGERQFGGRRDRMDWHAGRGA